MSSIKEDFVLDLHPLDGTDFIGTIKIEEVEEPNYLETIIILDQSGSMGYQVYRFINMIIPLVLSLLNYDESQYVHLITFEDCSVCYYNTAEQFKKFNIRSARGTYLSHALKHLKMLLSTFEADQPIRILTISDGAILDREMCDTAMKEILEILKRSQFAINAQAVRLFTSNSQPDTKALCSLAMLNNTTTSSVIDISCDESDEVTATTIANLFLSDKFKCTKRLQLESKILYRFPWDLEPASEITLLPGLNLFWLKGVPTVAKISNAYVKVIKQHQVTLSKFQQLMEVKMDYFLDHLKVLKIVGTAEADNSVDKILKYFENQESALTRINGQKKISMLLGGIARDENFKNLDSAQMAEYLRVVTRAHIEEKQKKEMEDERERIRLEEIRKKAEESERVRLLQEEIRKQTEESERERLLQEEIRKEAEESEQERLLREEIRKQAEESERERLLQEEIRKQADESEQERLLQEEIRKKAEESERERLLQEEIRKQAEESERERLLQEEIRKKAEESEQERLLQEEIRKEAEESERERLLQEEIRKEAEESERERLLQEEIRKQAEESERERLLQEEIRKQAEESERERLLQEEIRKKAEEHYRKELEEERRKKQETEDQLKQEQEDERYRKQLEQEEHRKKQDIEDQRKKKDEILPYNQIFVNFLHRLVGYFANHKLNFFIIIFIIVFAIIELKLQFSSRTGCDL